MSKSIRDEIAKVKINHIVRSESELEFPDFIRCLRNTLGISRKMMASELGISQMKIYYKEEGKFSRMPEIEFLVTISKYFGVPKDLLISKAKDYVDRKPG